MKNLKMYEPGDRMVTLIKDNSGVLQSLGAFGISLGFGDRTVSETCEMNGVDTYTFLAVVNHTINGYADFENDAQISVPTLMRYLRASHAYYLDFQLPFIRRELQESVSEDDALGRLIMRLYDEYAHEIRRHMKYEEKTLFPYVESLIEGKPIGDYDIDTFSKHHGQTDQRLRELKLMIIKYLPADAHRNNLLTATLYDIYNNEEWLLNHSNVEEVLFVPAIRLLEQKVKEDDVSARISSMIRNAE
ncbi:MAG: hemerythrin domain-containing protein, partial [Prevotella sp.]|nr:hemerythrin domain-containing protein [Prevotella sp.]